MMIALGQRRPSRTTLDPLTTDPTEDAYLPTAVMIADRVAAYHRSAGEHGRIASVRLADGEIRPDQRFYDVEYQQAAHRLAALFSDTTAQLWYQFLTSYMGYRLVSMPFCKYGEEPDRVTRQCVEKRVTPPVRIPVIPPVPDPLIPDVPPTNGDRREGGLFDTGLILPLVIGGVGLVFLLGGRK